MHRILLAVFAALTMAALGFGASPAAAYVGDYSFSDRSSASRPARAEQRSARAPRTYRHRTASRHRAAPRRSAEARRARSTARHARASTGHTGGTHSSGIASFYWQPQRTASGVQFNPNAYTAAHRTLPFGTRVLVTNLNNGRTVTVSINDRGPFIGGRIIDLSRAAAQAVGMVGSGLARVSIAVVGR